MPTERVQRQIDRLLDQTEESIEQGDWNTVIQHSRAVLRLEPENEDARAFCRKAGYRPELAWSLCDYADMLLEHKGDGDSEKAVAIAGRVAGHLHRAGHEAAHGARLSRREILKA